MRSVTPNVRPVSSPLRFVTRLTLRGTVHSIARQVATVSQITNSFTTGDNDDDSRSPTGTRNLTAQKNLRRDVNIW